MSTHQPGSLSPGPDFMCIGAQKAGTRWLYDQLQHHADFWMPPVKEFHYFDLRAPFADRARQLCRKAAIDPAGTTRERAEACNRPLDSRDIEFLTAYSDLIQARQPSAPSRTMLALSSFTSRHVRSLSGLHREFVVPVLGFRTTRPDFHGYARLFAHKGQKLSGDITPGYSTLRDITVKQILHAFPALKVVFLARDPVERFWSAVNMHGSHSRHPWPETTRELERIFERANHTERSYQTQIAARWRRFVPAGNFAVFLFDDLLTDPADLRRRVLMFLGADPDKPSGSLPAGFNRKEQGTKRPLRPEFRERLAELLADELKASAHEFGGAATTWPAKYGL